MIYQYEVETRTFAGMGGMLHTISAGPINADVDFSQTRVAADVNAEVDPTVCGKFKIFDICWGVKYLPGDLNIRRVFDSV